MVEAEPDHLVGDEEVLERVRKDQQHQAGVQQLEEHDADEPVVEEELGDPESRIARPVPHRREIGDREVVDVERLVPALVRPVCRQVDVGDWASTPLSTASSRSAAMITSGKRGMSSGTRSRAATIATTIAVSSAARSARKLGTINAMCSQVAVQLQPLHREEAPERRQVERRDPVEEHGGDRGFGLHPGSGEADREAELCDADAPRYGHETRE